MHTIQSIKTLTEELKPRVLPGTWTNENVTDTVTELGYGWTTTDGMSIIYSISVYSGKAWMHVSCARRNRLPSWEDLQHIKDVLIGKEKQALQVLPPQAKHVNIHPNCLHLWHCIDGDGIPDFTRGTNQI